MLLEKDLDFNLASSDERKHSIYVDDPISDYFGFPEWQDEILIYDELEQLESLLGSMAVSTETELPADVIC